MDLTNASAIVIGGAGGFGSATVPRLAQKGAKVVFAHVSDERGEALAREVGSLYVPTGRMDEDDIAKAVKAAAGLLPLRRSRQTRRSSANSSVTGRIRRIGQRYGVHVRRC